MTQVPGQGLWENAVGQADLVRWAYEPVGVTGRPFRLARVRS